MTRAEMTQAVMPRAERPAGPLLLGVRHHGPGSARAVRAALDAARPQAVLVEGPPEADALLPLAADERMRPPVALLAHAVDDPGRAAFWPLAAFSPEWIAIRWALEHGVPVRFIDLPAANSLAMTQENGNGEGDEDRDGGSEEDGGADGEEGAEGPVARAPIDPIGVLARTAGYDDPERWWEDVVEHRTRDGEAVDPRAPFAALAEAMTALREVYGDGGHPRDAVREAHMRIQLRKACKEFGDDIAVVCGAWHVPALGTRTTLTADRALLKGLPKVKAELTWVPWSHRRLARHSGYGAGIDSPGWYGHLFDAPDRPIERWMTKVAGLMRDEDRFVSSAHVIEAVRLAETLAAMRGRPLAGLGETTDAIRAVMCEGSDVPLALVQDRLIVGEALGEVPDTAPAVPLQRDLTRQQRTLRLKPEAQERELELDLRKDNDAARSRLLHRLRILAVGWGEPAAGRASTGTFRESWRLRWEPELYVQVAEAGTWGTTVLSAATAKAGAQAASATALAEVTALAEQCLLAELPDALPVVMRALADRAALDSDVGRLADALPALARTLRYGDVRSTDTAALAGVAAGLAERICVGLPPACTGLDADGAAELRGRVDEVHTAIGLLTGAAPVNPGTATDAGTGTGTGTDADTSTNTHADTDTSTHADTDTGGLRGRWTAVLHKLAARDTVAGVVRGRATRLLLDEGRLAEDDAARLMGLALSPGTPPADAAEWIEGFVGGAAGGGMLLVHDERLLGLVDAWLTGVPADRFADVLPLLRRTFSAYEAGVRRTLGELVRRGPSAGGPAATGTGAGAGAPAPGFGPGLDEARADAVEPVLRLLLGLHDEPGPDGDARSGQAGRAANVEEPLGATG
ncbi:MULTISPECIES: DUF5682 family protein [unclassified Streptomyces]|uniref:DUF5682 family protein n=1 Tax=unclassified Streptomyces TaxID=2593676 RepID=UPI0022521C23|nr:MULTISPECIES: DUF5682 family protein [unclassified Streptomyces]MCX4865018.1 DUF5682 family protein [Streptomyces sp. NBC_00906]MCX4896256.1 DUF5682 family protein [Streptomyces sp. NBC_00892]